jgi:hypothetical protein
MEIKTIKKSNLIIHRLIDEELLGQPDRQLLLALANDRAFCQEFVKYQAYADQLQGIPSSAMIADFYQTVASTLEDFSNVLSARHEDFELKVLDIFYSKRDV